MHGPATLDLVVVGGGVIGLALARAFAASGREVVLLEAEDALGMHASARSSEVIHAGLYYPPGSLKARLCVRGKHLLYEYAAREGVPHARLGKLLLATHDAELPELERIAGVARANGVDDLAWLDAAEVRALEPAIVAVRALLSPSSGIIDSHALLAALERDALAAGAHVLTRTPLLAGRVLSGGGFVLELGGAEPARVRCRALVNAAGLRAPSVSRSLAGVSLAAIPAEHYAKGHYFALRGPSPFRRLVYPLPAAGGLGVHVTLDLAGQARFGPDVVWARAIDYAFDDERAPAFYQAIRAYYPALADGALAAGYTGIRAKLGPPGTTHDFAIQGPETTGAPGFVALYGIESPGLTASLAIAEHARSLLGDGDA